MRTRGMLQEHAPPSDTPGSPGLSPLRASPRPCRARARHRCPRRRRRGRHARPGRPLVAALTSAATTTAVLRHHRRHFRPIVTAAAPSPGPAPPSSGGVGVGVTPPPPASGALARRPKRTRRSSPGVATNASMRLSPGLLAQPRARRDAARRVGRCLAGIDRGPVHVVDEPEPDHPPGDRLADAVQQFHDERLGHQLARLAQLPVPRHDPERWPVRRGREG